MNELSQGTGEMLYYAGSRHMYEKAYRVYEMDDGRVGPIELAFLDMPDVPQAVRVAEAEMRTGFVEGWCQVFGAVQVDSKTRYLRRGEFDTLLGRYRGDLAEGTMAHPSGHPSMPPPLPMPPSKPKPKPYWYPQG